MKNLLFLLLLTPMLAIGVACSDDDNDNPNPNNNANNGGNAGPSGPFCQDCVITSRVTYSGSGTSNIPDSEATTTGRYCDDALTSVKAQEGRTTSSSGGVTVTTDVDVSCN